MRVCAVAGWRIAKLLILTTTQTNFRSCRLLPPLFPTSLASGQTCCKHAPEFPSRTPSSIRAQRTLHGSPSLFTEKVLVLWEKYLFRLLYDRVVFRITINESSIAGIDTEIMYLRYWTTKRYERSDEDRFFFVLWNIFANIILRISVH